MPHIKFRPIGKREDTHRFTAADLGVEQVPKFRALIAWVPSVIGAAEREDAFLRPALFLVTARATHRRIEAVRIKRLLQCLCLHDVCMQGGPRVDGVYATLQAFFVDVDNQLETELFGYTIAKRDHFPELPRGVHVHQRKGNTSGVKGFAGKVQQYAGIFTDRIKHNRVTKLACHLVDDRNGFGFKTSKMRR